MKKISLILLLFLLPLCLVPPTSAVYGDESPQSITSFTETLPDDVLYFSDAFVTGVELADYGEISDESYSADYILTNVKDGSAFNETSATDIEIWFEVDTTDGFEGFSYAHYLNVDSGTDIDLAAYNFDGDTFVKIDEPLPSSYAWMNGTISDPDFWNTTHIAFAMHELVGNADLYWDYGEITLHRMTLVDSDHYGESFADISDWDVTGGTISISSDGDVMTHEADSWQHSFSNDISLASMEGYYLEYRLKSNVTHSIGEGRAYGYKEDERAGGAAFYDNVAWLTTWQTYKVYLPSSLGYSAGVLESVSFTSGLNNIKLEIEYSRIFRGNESGWQHDGSTIEGVDTVDLGTGAVFSLSTDGDILNMTVTRPSGSIGQVILDITLDTTATSAKAEYDYYQFFKSNFSVTTSDCVVGWDIETDGFRNTNTTTNSDWWIYRWNAKAFTTASVGNRIVWWSSGFEVGDSFTILFDYGKLYSIANFTVTLQGGVSTSTYLYADDGRLVSSGGGESNFIWLDHDIPLSVATGTYSVLNLTKQSGTIYTKVVVDYAWSDWNSETRYAPDLGDLTDVRIKFASAGSISAIKFIDTRDWQEIGEVEFVIPVGWDPTFLFGYDAFFIFLGLILIPVSTMYLVRGGREEASADKVFYFLIIFMIGFGLLVGGIMP